ncbi:MAG: PINc/VapC family ATPase [Candidatus Aenigmarchaeota archaeon]
MKNENTKKSVSANIVPDTSVLIIGTLSDRIKSGKIKNVRILIPKAAIDELQAQASRGHETGFKGLEEIKAVRALGKKKGIEVDFPGARPTLEEIHLAKKGRIDALIRDVAAKYNGKLLTADYVQALVAEAEDVAVEYVPQPFKKKVRIESFFKEGMQSLHLKVGVPPMAKVGKPGEVRLVQLNKKKVEEDELKAIIDEIVYQAKKKDDAFIEIGRAGATVIQMGEYRISITRPPFSEAMELTAVRPIAKVSLDDYQLHEELKGRFVSKSQGVLITGPPGEGKTSFAGAMAEFLSKKGKIVKTFEQPRDLQVGPEITQYGPLEGDWAKSADILLLVRPDYTIFDEIRKTSDFRIFGDMRLAGVGMIGVVHASSPVSAIQRFIGRVELGMIPNIIDTVIFVEAGKVSKVYEMVLSVKVPSGMTEADLARPVVEVKDFATKKAVYEIYTFGNENVIIPVKEDAKGSPVNELAKQRVEQELRKYDPSVEVEVVGANKVIARVRNESMARLIGRKGENINSLEKRLGISIDVQPREATMKQGLKWRHQESGAFVNIIVDQEHVGEQVDIYRADEYIFSPHVGKGGAIKVKKKSSLGSKIMGAIYSRRLRVMA